MTPRRRRLEERRRGRGRFRGRAIGVAALGLVLVLGGAVLAGAFVLGKASEDLPNLSQLKPVPLGQGESICYSLDGKSLYLTAEGSPCPLWVMHSFAKAKAAIKKTARRAWDKSSAIVRRFRYNTVSQPLPVSR